MPKANETIHGGPPKTAPKASRLTRQPPKSAEFVISSGSDSDSSGKSSGNESDSSESLNNKKPLLQGEQHTTRSDLPVASDTDSGSDSEESSSSGSSGASSGTSSHGGSKREKQGRVSGQVAEVDEKSAAPPLRATDTRPRKPYEPPHGFQPLKRSASSASTISKIFQSGSLHGKQIWHIAAGASIPLQSITEVALDALAKGDPVLQHKGIDYALSSSTSEELRGLKTLVPSESEDVYGPVSLPITRSLHFQQVLRLPSIGKSASGSRGPSGAASVQTPAIKKARPQPKGLKMRYLPSGFGDGKPGVIGSSSSDDSGETDRFQSRVPMFPNAGDGPKKRKLEEVVDGDTSKPGKKIRTDAAVKAHGARGMNAPDVDGPEKSTGVNGAGSNPTNTLHKSNHTELELKDGHPDGSKEKIEETSRRADKERRRKERQERRENKAKYKEEKK